ncbi:UNVERIFIED_CONTAM: hypothetical protein FKN15_042317 [Acipenser sinensis]
MFTDTLGLPYYSMYTGPVWASSGLSTRIAMHSGTFDLSRVAFTTGLHLPDALGFAVRSGPGLSQAVRLQYGVVLVYHKQCGYLLAPPLPPPLLRLWRHCAVVAPVDYAARRARERLERREEEEESEMEVVLEAVEPSMAQIEISVEPAQPEVEAERPILEGIPEEIGVPEEREELEEPRGEEAVTAESVLRLAAEQIERFGETYFDILAPHGILRKVAAVLFFRVLELCERRVLM